MDLMDPSLGSSGVLIDGSTSWSSVAEGALATWNLYVNSVQFTVWVTSPKPRGSSDGYNQVFFDSSVYGQSFGQSTLAITVTWLVGTTRTESDVIFNSSKPWNSYRGNLQLAAGGGMLNDFRRVALHEFGHVLGLSHPDQAGQTVIALMNSTIGNLDALTTDDTTGAAQLYYLPAPSAPTANSATSVTSSAFTANWSSVSGSAGYRLDVSTSSAFNIFVNGYQNLDVGNVTSRTVSGLNANTTYYYRVRAYNSAGPSGNSGTITVTTLPPIPPPAPTVNAATGVSTYGFTANWNSASGASGYRLDVSTSGAFSSYVSGHSNLSVGNVTTWSVSGLTANTTYYYRVRAYNSGGTSGNSGTISVRILPNPPPAPIVNAATSVSTNGFTANWNSAGDASGYWLDVSASSTFGSYVSGYQNLNVGNTTSQSVTGLNANTTYYYRVRAYNYGGMSGDSGTITATTLSIPPSINTQPKSRNMPVGGSVTFNVLASGSPPLSYQWRRNDLNIPGASSTSYTISGVLTNHDGNYTVVVSNAAGAITSSVAVLTVTIPPPGAVFITNAGFESPVTMDGQENGDSGYTVPGWVESGEEEPNSHLWAWDIYNPAVATMASEAHGGENALNTLAYLPSTQYVEQQLNAQLIPNTRYTLSAWVADPDPKNPLNSVRLMLFAGLTLLGSTEIQPQVVDTWTSGSLVVETGGTHPQAGQALKVRIMWGNHSSYRVFVDDVSLTALPVVPLVFASINRQSNGDVLLNMNSPTGKNVIIYASPDLLNWLPVATLTNTAATLQFLDTTAGNFERRFYKATAQ